MALMDDEEVKTYTCMEKSGSFQKLMDTALQRKREKNAKIAKAAGNHPMERPDDKG